MPTINEIITQKRLQAKITQLELAHQSGITVTTVSRIESGKTPDPGFNTCARLLKAIGQTILIKNAE